METPNTEQVSRILSLFLYHIIYKLSINNFKYRNCYIRCNRGEDSDTNIIPHKYIEYSIIVSVCLKQNILTIMFMASNKTRVSPVQREKLRLPPPKWYKVCNRYTIGNTTLHDFGLEIDQRMLEHPLVWRSDKMVSNPEMTIEEEGHKPFCCTHCGSESYMKYGKDNGKQVYKCKECNRKFVDNLYFEKLKVDPKTIIPEVSQVGNGFVSIVGYQAQGYEVVVIP